MRGRLIMNQENQKKQTRRRKPSTFDLLPEEVKERGKKIAKENRCSNFELCYIFKVDPEIYEGVSISQLDFSTRVRNSLTKWMNVKVYDDLREKSQYYKDFDGCKTVADVLRLTIGDMEKARCISKVGEAEVLVMTKKFIDEEKDFGIKLRNIYNNSDVRQRRLGYALNSLMHGRDYNNISYNETEKAIIEKYKTAIELLDFDLCKAAFNGDKAVYDIIRALHAFSGPELRYTSFINEINKKICGLSEQLKYKSAKALIIKYYITEDIRLDSRFLLTFDEYISLINFPKHIPKLEMGNRNTMSVLSDFIDWLVANDN